MNSEINVKKKTVYIAVAIGLAFVLMALFFFGNISTTVLTSSEGSNMLELEAKFAVLDSANSNSCGGTFDFVDGKLEGERIQGSCCGPMNFHRYTEQIQGLTKYSKLKIIPSDPYDVPASAAKELLEYQKNIVLKSEEQAIYDEAVDESDEGGPCCCKCWHWYAYEGLAKYLITVEGFTAEQIAEVWDLSDACGGADHVDGSHT